MLNERNYSGVFETSPAILKVWFPDKITVSDFNYWVLLVSLLHNILVNAIILVVAHLSLFNYSAKYPVKWKGLKCSTTLNDGNEIQIGWVYQLMTTFIHFYFIRIIWKKVNVPLLEHLSDDIFPNRYFFHCFLPSLFLSTLRFFMLLKIFIRLM